MHFGRCKEVQRELHGPGHVVLVPLAEDVFLEKMHETLGALENGKERHQDEGYGEHTVQHTHGVREVAAHDAAAERGHEHKQTGECKQDAGDRSHPVRDTSQKRMTLNVAGHVLYS